MWCVPALRVPLVHSQIYCAAASRYNVRVVQSVGKQSLGRTALCFVLLVLLTALLYGTVWCLSSSRILGDPGPGDSKRAGQASASALCSRVLGIVLFDRKYKAEKTKAHGRAHITHAINKEKDEKLQTMTPFQVMCFCFSL